MKNSLLILALIFLLNPPKLASFARNDVSSISIQADIAQDYIEELEKFVISLNRVKYQPESYWKEVDLLWDSLKTKKKELIDQFSKRQLRKIKRLERKYLRIREKQPKWS